MTFALDACGVTLTVSDKRLVTLTYRLAVERGEGDPLRTVLGQA